MTGEKDNLADAGPDYRKKIAESCSGAWMRPDAPMGETRGPDRIGWPAMAHKRAVRRFMVRGRPTMPPDRFGPHGPFMGFVRITRCVALFSAPSDHTGPKIEKYSILR